MLKNINIYASLDHLQPMDFIQEITILVLELINTFNDLGIIFDCKLDFRTVSKATCILAFIKRLAKEFSHPCVTEQLFTTLVRPILEYDSVIWNPQYLWLRNIRLC